MSDPIEPENNIRKVLRILIAPYQDLENVFQQILMSRVIDDAEGESLNMLGRIVGQARDGFSDEDYRRLIRARVAANRSSGAIEHVLDVVRLTLNDPDAYLHLTHIDNATMVLKIEDVATAADVATLVMRMARQVAAGGVRLILEWGVSAPAEWFRFDSGPGFDQGRLAGALD
jgi:hypothetical protein